MGGRRRQAWAMRTKVLPSTSSASGTAKRRQIWRKISGVADDRSRHGGCDGDHRLVDGSARSSTGRPGRSGQGLAHASDEISWALPAIADAVARKHQDLPRDADGHIRTRLLEGLWTHGSGHLLSAFLSAGGSMPRLLPPHHLTAACRATPLPLSDPRYRTPGEPSLGNWR